MKQTPYDSFIEKLAADSSERCPALDSYGSQCQLSQGHGGKHGVSKHLAYFKHARGLYNA